MYYNTDIILMLAENLIETMLLYASHICKSLMITILIEHVNIC